MPTKTLNLIHYCEQKGSWKFIEKERERESWEGNSLDVTTTFESWSTATKSRIKERKNKSRGRKETPLLFDKSKVLTKIIKHTSGFRQDGWTRSIVMYFWTKQEHGREFPYST